MALINKRSKLFFNVKEMEEESGRGRTTGQKKYYGYEAYGREGGR
jgi:hypothetical protein